MTAAPQAVTTPIPPSSVEAQQELQNRPLRVRLAPPAVCLTLALLCYREGEAYLASLAQGTVTPHAVSLIVSVGLLLLGLLMLLAAFAKDPVTPPSVSTESGLAESDTEAAVGGRPAPQDPPQPAPTIEPVVEAIRSAAVSSAELAAQEKARADAAEQELRVLRSERIGILSGSTDAGREIRRIVAEQMRAESERRLAELDQRQERLVRTLRAQLEAAQARAELALRRADALEEDLRADRPANRAGTPPQEGRP